MLSAAKASVICLVATVSFLVWAIANSLKSGSLAAISTSPVFFMVTFQPIGNVPSGRASTCVVLIALVYVIESSFFRTTSADSALKSSK